MIYFENIGNKIYLSFSIDLHIIIKAYLILMIYFQSIFKIRIRPILQNFFRKNSNIFDFNRYSSKYLKNRRNVIVITSRNICVKIKNKHQK